MEAIDAQRRVELQESCRIATLNTAQVSESRVYSQNYVCMKECVARGERGERLLKIRLSPNAVLLEIEEGYCRRIFVRHVLRSDVSRQIM